MKSVFLRICAHLVLLAIVFEVVKARVIDIKIKVKAENILESSAILQKKIDDILKLAKAVETSSTESSPKPGEKECLVNENLKNIITEIEKQARGVISGSYNLFLEQMKQELLNIDTALEKDLDKEIETCKKSNSDCRITGEFERTIKDDYELIFYLEQLLKRLPEYISLTVNKAHDFKNFISKPFCSEDDKKI